MTTQRFAASPFRRRRPQRGQIIIMGAVSLVVLIASVGLAIDSGFGYLVKAKLNAAVDSAAIAAAKAVTQGTNETNQRASAIRAAQDFFAANYPVGYLGSTPTLDTPVVNFNQGEVTIDVSATAAVPVTLMRVLNFNLLNVAAAGQAIRKDLDLAFVIDTSGSMQPSGSKVKENAKLFLSKFNANLDRVALMHFSYGAVVDEPIKWSANPVPRGFDRNKMNNDIDNYTFSGLTNSSEGFWNARDQLNKIRLRDRSSLRVIVFFSDGAPNTLSSQFKFQSNTVCRNGKGFLKPGSLNSNDAASGNLGGLSLIDQQSGALSGCSISSNALASDAIPAWYNAHPDPVTNANVDEFPLVGGGPRAITSAATYRNVNRASRNLAEAMAAKARSEGIYVFTLGLGDNLTKGSGPDGERGDVVLKCMANTQDAAPNCVAAGAGQPIGLYCHAQTADDLKPCFAKLASAILRLSQ